MSFVSTQSAAVLKQNNGAARVGYGNTTVAQQLDDIANDADNNKGGRLIGYRGRTVASRLDDVVNVKDYGAVGNDIVNDTGNIQLAANAVGLGGALYFPFGVYSVETITLPNNIRLIYGPGIIKQRSTGQKNFVGNGNDGLEITGLQFTGAATGGSSSLADDTAIELVSAQGLNIHNCRFKNYSYNTIYLLGCEDSIVVNSEFNKVAHAVRFRGCKRVSAVANHGNGTILSTVNQSVPIGLDSTNGHAHGICEDVLVMGNRFSNQPYGEGILIHAGVRVSVIGNVFRKFSFGVGINPYNDVDDIQDISIGSNTFEGVTAADWPTVGVNDADEAIFVGGAANTTRPTNIAITGNTITHFNHVVDHHNQGGIVLGYSKNVNISGNNIRDCRNNGIAVLDEALSCQITGNIISDSVFNAASTLKNGIRVNHANADVFINGNSLSEMKGVNSNGIRIDAGNIRLGDNKFTNVDHEHGIYGGTVLQKELKSVNSGSSIDLNGAELVELDSTAANIVIDAASTMFASGVRGKTYLFTNVGSNNTATLQYHNTYCQTEGGLDLVLSPNESAQFIGVGVNRLRQVTGKLSVTA